ncbi:hypothetical protein GIB67_036970 [Kingdonia uniflora]|uniref:Uncharacterized protein n=1 Tax=Kingdonia uniflora TaxID=39325 RepID=A0A7J7NWD5_9MAGN|nr:hypothetical protein GIB67_036970 [Kingdonia uniflora]
MMRIADSLVADKYEDRDVSSCQSIISRCVSSFRRSSCSSKRWLGSLMGEKREDLSQRRSSTGRYLKDASFNLGVGVGLTLLLAASKNEFDKMTKLRKQMELLIIELKNKGEDAIFAPSQSNFNQDFSATSSPEVGSEHYQPTICTFPLLHNLAETEVTVDCNRQARCESFDIYRKEEPVLGFDQLEAELEAELQHLELTLDAEALLQHAEQQPLEIFRVSTTIRHAVGTLGTSLSQTRNLAEDWRRDIDGKLGLLHGGWACKAYKLEPLTAMASERGSTSLQGRSQDFCPGGFKMWDRGILWGIGDSYTMQQNCTEKKILVRDP